VSLRDIERNSKESVVKSKQGVRTPVVGSSSSWTLKNSLSPVLLVISVTSGMLGGCVEVLCVEVLGEESTRGGDVSNS
jgi:hypothetical protein